MATKLLDGYTYEKNTQRYRNSATGKFVARKTVVSLLDSQVQGAEDRMDKLTQALADEKIIPAVYVERMRTETRRLHLQQAALAKGGWDNLGQSDYGRVGAATRDVYAKISGTASDIVNGDVSVAQANNRNRAYAGSARRVYHAIERDQVTPSSDEKVPVEQRILDPAAQHCEDCLSYAQQGVELAGVLPVPGEDCQCRDNCRCQLRRWEVNRSELDKVLGVSESKSMAKDNEIEIQGNPISLVEKAIRSDGTMPVKLIQPGWGTSGYYSPELLERDGAEVFKAGTQMFWDHPTATQESERPEGSLSNLAAVLVTDARYQEDGIDGPGLYADAKPFGEYKDSLEELAPHIGVSIRASGQAKRGKVDGKEGPIVEKITSRRSADFVTVAGAGGKIIELFESARDGKTIELAEGPPKDKDMSEDVKLRLEEAEKTIAALTEQNQKLMETQERVTKDLVIRESMDFLVAEVRKSNLRPESQERVAKDLAKNMPITDGILDKETFAATIEEACKAEDEYLSKIFDYSGQIRGMGSSTQRFEGAEFDEKETEKRLSEAFSGFLGLDADEAKIAARGRL